MFRLSYFSMPISSSAFSLNRLNKCRQPVGHPLQLKLFRQEKTAGPITKAADPGPLLYSSPFEIINTNTILVSSTLTVDQKLDKLIAFLERSYRPNLIGDKPEPQPPILKPAKAVMVLEPVTARKLAKILTVGRSTHTYRALPELFKNIDNPANRNIETHSATEAITNHYVDYPKVYVETRKSVTGNRAGH